MGNIPNVTNAGLSNHKLDHLRGRVEVKGLAGVTRDREELAEHSRAARPYVWLLGQCIRVACYPLAMFTCDLHV